MIHKNLTISNSGSLIDVVCARVGGENTTPNFLSVLFALQKMNPVGAKKEIPNPARIHSPDPFLRAGKFAEVLPNPFPQKNSFGKTESVLKPHALPEYLEGRTPKKNVLSFFKKNFTPAKSEKQETFFFGVAGVLASARGFLRIICFESRFELGTIKTPIQNSTAFSKPEGGTREARPTDSPPFFQTNSEFLARWRALIFRQGGGSKSEAILTNSICLIQKQFLLHDK